MRKLRSIEYIFLTIALLTAALSLILFLIVRVNSHLDKVGVGFSSMALPAAGLVIGLPVLAGLWLHVKFAEAKNPSLKLNTYKRWCNNLVEVVTFSTCFFALIGLVFGLFVHAGASGGGNLLSKLLADVIIILAVASGILVFYIVNDSKPDKQ